MDRRVFGWCGPGAGPGSGWRAGAHGEVQARLKVNGKFECLELQEAEVKKGSRVDNFPADPAERQGLKYFEGQPANTSQVSSTPAVEEEPASVAIGQGTPDAERRAELQAVLEAMGTALTLAA